MSLLDERLKGDGTMPLVSINRDPEVISDEVLRSLARALLKIVADALHTPEATGSEPHSGGSLTPDEIEVRIRDRHPLDVNTEPLEITVLANYFTERAINLDERRSQIADGVRDLVPNLVGKNNAFVWVLLAPASFEMI